MHSLFYRCQDSSDSQRIAHSTLSYLSKVGIPTQLETTTLALDMQDETSFRGKLNWRIRGVAFGTAIHKINRRMREHNETADERHNGLAWETERKRMRRENEMSEWTCLPFVGIHTRWRFVWEWSYRHLGNFQTWWEWGECSRWFWCELCRQWECGLSHLCTWKQECDEGTRAQPLSDCSCDISMDV